MWGGEGVGIPVYLKSRCDDSSSKEEEYARTLGKGIGMGTFCSVVLWLNSGMVAAEMKESFRTGLGLE